MEDELRELFSSLGSLTQDSSKLHNRKEDVIKYKKASIEFETDSNSGDRTARELEHLEEQLKKSKKQAIYSVNEIKKVKDKSINDRKLMVVYDFIINDLDVIIDDEEIDLDLNVQTYPITLSQLNSEEKKLVMDIFSIIKDNLSWEKAEMLKKKIAEKYN